MRNKLTKSLAPFVIFGVALAIPAGWFFLQSKFDWDFLMLVDILAVFLFFWLTIEAAAQANPEQAASPLRKFLVKYSKRRDRVVVLMATIGVLAFFSLAARFEGNPFLIIVLSIFGATVIYYGICLLFGTQELRELAVPDFIKRAIFHKDETDE